MSKKYDKIVPFTASELMLLHGLTVDEALAMGMPVVGYTKSKSVMTKSQKSQMADLELIGTREAAAIIGISPTTLSDYCARGKIKAIRIGRFWGITQSEIKKFTESRRKPI